MSPEQSQYIWRKTISHIEVGKGSGVCTSHRSAREWYTIEKQEAKSEHREFHNLLYSLEILLYIFTKYTIYDNMHRSNAVLKHFRLFSLLFLIILNEWQGIDSSSTL